MRFDFAHLRLFKAKPNQSQTDFQFTQIFNLLTNLDYCDVFHSGEPVYLVNILFSMLRRACTKVLALQTNAKLSRVTCKQEHRLFCIALLTPAVKILLVYYAPFSFVPSAHPHVSCTSYLYYYKSLTATGSRSEHDFNTRFEQFEEEVGSRFKSVEGDIKNAREEIKDGIKGLKEDMKDQFRDAKHTWEQLFADMKTDQHRQFALFYSRGFFGVSVALHIKH